MIPFYLKPRIIQAAILAAGVSLAGCGHKLAPQGHYQDTPVVADGQTDDWHLPLRFSNERYTIQYNVTNDNTNFYICVLSWDNPTELRMMRDGMTIYFDPKGEKKNKDISLHFPLRKQPDPADDRVGGGGQADFRPVNGVGSQTDYRAAGNGAYNRSRNGSQVAEIDYKTRKKELLLQSDNFGTTGFQDIENGQFGVADVKSPVHVAIQLNRQDSVLVYEAIVPISQVLGANWKSRSPKKGFSLGIMLNAPPVQSGVGYNGHPHNGGRGMGINGMRGIGGGRRYGSGGGQSQAPKEKEDISWYQFRLAGK